jgi:hypothetical protein
MQAVKTAWGAGKEIWIHGWVCPLFPCTPQRDRGLIGRCLTLNMDYSTIWNARLGQRARLLLLDRAVGETNFRRIKRKKETISRVYTNRDREGWRSYKHSTSSLSCIATHSSTARKVHLQALLVAHGSLISINCSLVIQY